MKSIGNGGAIGWIARSRLVGRGSASTPITWEDALDDAALVLGTVQSLEDVAAAGGEEPAELTPRELTIAVDQRVRAGSHRLGRCRGARKVRSRPHSIGQQVEMRDPPP